MLTAVNLLKKYNKTTKTIAYDFLFTNYLNDINFKGYF